MFFSTQWKLRVQAALNITVESSYNFNLSSLIVHVNVAPQERQNLLLPQRARTKDETTAEMLSGGISDAESVFFHP